MDIVLSDGSKAQCGRRAHTGSVYCTQHARMLVRNGRKPI